eukprot:1161414-Pelagomonas_calceolata.AAC.9
MIPRQTKLQVTQRVLMDVKTAKALRRNTCANHVKWPELEEDRRDYEGRPAWPCSLPLIKFAGFNVQQEQIRDSLRCNVRCHDVFCYKSTQLSGALWSTYPSSAPYPHQHHAHMCVAAACMHDSRHPAAPS